MPRSALCTAWETHHRQHSAPSPMAAAIYQRAAPEAEAPASSADLGDTRAFDQIQFGKDYEIE